MTTKPSKNLTEALDKQAAAEHAEDRNTHQDAVGDTGEAYTQFHGWILSCLWCEYRAMGKTKREAFAKLVTHYEAFDINIY